MSRIRSAASARSNVTATSVRTSRTNRTARSRDAKASANTMFEYPCNPCRRENTNAEATHYCQDCGENLCADCVKQHLKFQSMKGHKILGKPERKAYDENVSAPKLDPLECSEHPGKKVDMYCADHNEVWCGACIAVHHRTCQSVMLIQSAAKEIAKRDEYKEAKENIRRVKKDLMTLKRRAEKDIARIDKQKVVIMNKIQESRKRIDKVLDDMERATISELERVCNRVSSQMQDDTSLDAIGGMLTATKSGTDGEVAVFIGTKRATKKIQEGKRIVNFVRHTVAADPIKYVPDGRVVDWLKSIRFLGTFSHQEKVYIGSYLERHDISVADEFKDCDMFGSTFLNDGRLLLTDWDNKKVKLLDTSYELVDQIVLPGNPDDICSTNPEEAAVTLTMQKNIQFIQLVPKMQLTRTINTEEHCRGITYHDGQIYVVCGGFKYEADGKIVVYNISGEHVRTIDRNNAGQKIFTCPIAVTVVSDGKLLYVTDGQRGIVTLTSNNDVVSVISNKDVSWPCGICVDRNDNAITCNGRSNNVIQLFGLDKIAVILTKKDGVKRPHSICFDPNTLRIIMTTHKSKFISVFQLSSPSVEQVAEGTNVILNVVENDPKGETKADAIDTSGASKEDERGTKTDTTKLSTGTELQTPTKPNSLTNGVAVRSSQSKEHTSDISDQESVISKTGKSKANLADSREKSTSRESVVKNVTGRRSDNTSQFSRAGTSRINSARNSRMSGRVEMKDTTFLNKSSRNNVSRKSSIS